MNEKRLSKETKVATPWVKKDKVYSTLLRLPPGKKKKREMTRERIWGKMRIGECRHLLGGGEGIPGKNREQL